MSTKTEAERARDLGRLVTALGVALFVLCLYTLVSQLPQSALSLPGEEQSRPVFKNALTQGWSFFTKNPNSAAVVPYRATPDGGWSIATTGPQGTPRNLFGLDRSTRGQNVEVGLLQSEAPPDSWADCDTSAAQCLSGMTAQTVRNPARNPTLCGPTALVSSHPVPWAWRDIPGVVAPMRIVRLSVECDNDE